MSEQDNHIHEKHLTDSGKINKVRENLPGRDILDSMSQIFSLLADPTRLKIVIALKTSELCVHEIAETIGLSISAVSHQLRLLKTAKVVRNRRDGKMVYYALDDEHVEQLLSVVDHHIRE
jgi:ArsR family transcriptional regulator